MREFPVLQGVPCSPVLQRREQHYRTLLHRAADTFVIARGDDGGGHTLVVLNYEDLSDSDVDRLLSFHEDCQGRLEPFVFPDPAGNLLRWSANWSTNVWTASPGLALRRLEAAERRDAHELTNNGQEWGGVAQQVSALGERPISVGCLARGNGALLKLRIDCGAQRVEKSFLLDASWSGCEVSAEQLGDETVRISVLTSPGGQVEAAELCAATQVGRPAYRATGVRSGFHMQARFDDDRLEAVATAPGLYRATVRVMLLDEVPAP